MGRIHPPRSLRSHLAALLLGGCAQQLPAPAAPAPIAAPTPTLKPAPLRVVTLSGAICEQARTADSEEESLNLWGEADRQVMEDAAFFPITNLPPAMQWLAVATPLWHGVDPTHPAYALPSQRPAAESLAERVTHLPIRSIYTGPLERSQESAWPLAMRLMLELRVHEGFDEIDFGQWTRKTFDELEPEKRPASGDEVLVALSPLRDGDDVIVSLNRLTQWLADRVADLLVAP